jgi:tRNA threonylcarbamoyl adenosine modification protein (Sua5/YciO/YrdC/YwlC family)
MYDRHAIDRIFNAKGRSRDNPIPILVASIEELSGVAEHVSPIAQKLAERFWPGPLTLVVRRRQDVPNEISPTTKVGVRVPDHELTLRLLGLAGPLAVTSANRSGESTSRTAEEVLKALGGRIEMILDGGTTPGGIPSTVVDSTTDVPQVLRQGPISGAEIMEVLARM